MYRRLSLPARSGFCADVVCRKNKSDTAKGLGDRLLFDGAVRGRVERREALVRVVGIELEAPRERLVGACVAPPQWTQKRDAARAAGDRNGVGRWEAVLALDAEVRAVYAESKTTGLAAFENLWGGMRCATGLLPVRPGEVAAELRIVGQPGRSLRRALIPWRFRRAGRWGRCSRPGVVWTSRRPSARRCSCKRYACYWVVICKLSAQVGSAGDKPISTPAW